MMARTKHFFVRVKPPNLIDTFNLPRENNTINTLLVYIDVWLFYRNKTFLQNGFVIGNITHSNCIMDTIIFETRKLYEIR